MRTLSPTRSLAAVTLLLAGIAILAIGWTASPLRISIRFTPETNDQARAQAEQALQLDRPRFEGGRTWSYDLRDPSPARIEPIFHYPAVEDWAGITRDYTLKPDAPPLQAWLQVHYTRPSIKWIAASWWVGGPALCVLGLVAAWPAIARFAAGADLRVAIVVLVSAALRLSLILSGGQYYWPDERQYREAQHLVATALAGDPAWVRELLDAPSAVVLKTVGAAPALIESLTGENSHIPALFFGLSSSVTIWLVAAIARRLDATRDAAFVAALSAAGSTALFYTSRHLLSYDLALMFGLFGAFTAVNQHGGRTASLLTGAWAVVSFLAYAGAWTLAGAICAIHVVDARTTRDAVRRACLAIAGSTTIIAAFGVGYRAAGMSWLRRMAQFAGTVRQGEFDEGWRLPVEYLWHAEHLLLVVWLASMAWCVARLNWSFRTRIARAALVGVTCIYGALACSSTLLEQFVVYGRLCRPLVPFCCLLTAAVIGSTLDRTGRWRLPLLAVVTIAVAAQAAVNFRVPLRQQFPFEFVARVERRYPEPRLFVNARHLYPGPEPVTIPPGYKEVASASHPLEFLPYQYEGYAEGERRGLRAADLRMRAYVGPSPSR